MILYTHTHTHGDLDNNKNKVYWWENFKSDYKKNYEEDFSIKGFLKIMKNRRVRYMLYGRASCSKNKIINTLGKTKLKKYEKKYGLEINFRNIGPGVLLAHPFNITINGKAIIKGDCTIFKGVTIGSIRSGKREGVPTIEKNVVCCINSVIVGNVHIGEDVLIAPNSYVNFDVPNHSVVVGNPGTIHYKENATKDYRNGK